MALVFEVMNEERSFGMKKPYSLLDGETHQEFADFTALHGPRTALL